MNKQTIDPKTKFRVQGKVVKVLPGSDYLVEIKVGDKSHQLLGYISGKMRRHYIRLTGGDNIEVEISPYDKTRCRIVYRLNASNKVVADLTK